MNHFDDDRVLFYLKHEKLIREWAQIEKEAWAAVDGFLTSLSDAVEALASAQGDDVRFAVADNSPTYPNLAMYREGWADASGAPRVTVRLEWQRNRTSLTHSPRPYTGIRVNLGLPLGKALHLHLSGLSAVVRRQNRYTVAESWPAYRHVPAATGEYWSDLGGHRDVMLSELRTTWQLFGTYADLAVAEVVEVNDT